MTVTTKRIATFYSVVPLFSVLAGMAMLCYHLTVVTPPGTPPADLVPFEMTAE
jgi:hypothetical protein